MIPYKKYRADLMSSKEMAEQMKKNKMVILPVGCFEMHGPLLPLACDTLLDWGMCLILAAEWDSVVYPPVYYTYPGASATWPGTVDISTEVTEAYIKEIIRALFKNGFERVVLVGSHGPLGFMLTSAVRSYFHDTNKVVAYFSPYEKIFPNEECVKALGYEKGEDIMAFAGMKLLGLESAFDLSCKINIPMANPKDEGDKIKKMGIQVPWLFDRDFQHTGIRSCLKPEDADKAIEVMKKCAKKYRDFPKMYAKYQKEMKALLKKKPWSKPSIWSV